MQGSKRRCSACRTGRTAGVSLFRFPLDEQRRRGWADFCEIDVSSIGSFNTLCSRHFTDGDFKTRSLGSRRKQLKDDAMPVIEISRSSSVDHVSCSHRNNYRKTPQNIKGKRRQCCYICGPVDSRLHRFVFPKDPSELNVWLNACDLNGADLRDGDRLCEAHFEEADICTYPTLSKLRKGAFPSKLLPSHKRAEMAISEDNRLLQTDNLNDFEKSCKVIQLDDGAAPLTFPALSENIACDEDPEDHSLQIEYTDVDGTVGDVGSFTPLILVTNTDQPTTSRSCITSRAHSVEAQLVQISPMEGSEFDVGDETSAIVPLKDVADSTSPIGCFGRVITSSRGAQVTPTTASSGHLQTPAIKRYPRHVSEISTPLCAGSKRAKMVLDVARKDILSARKRNKTLRNENDRLKNRVKVLENILNDLRSKNLLSEDAARLIKVQ